jgi:hypothetical protein
MHLNILKSQQMAYILLFNKIGDTRAYSFREVWNRFEKIHCRRVTTKNFTSENYQEHREGRQKLYLLSSLP